MYSMMTIKEKLYGVLIKNPGLSAQELGSCVGTDNRTYVAKLLSELRDEGKVEARKTGRNVKYFVIDGVVALEENLKLKGLHEDEIWEKVRKGTDFLRGLSENAENILYFAFTEMLNNAIDHSRSGVGYVKIWNEEGKLRFVVRDKGVGVFRNVMAKRSLETEIDAARELIKGKLTTQPMFHSGEGIFWTSKVADEFMLSSYDYRLTVDNLIEDYTIEKVEKDERVLGTEVRFTIAQDTAKSLQKLFREFSFDHQKLTLDTTVIPVKLFEEGDVWISRSQAKKVLTGLEKYKKILFDFSGIKVVGQAFADEIFRVFNIQHPEIVLEAINMTESVELMVERARNDETGRK